MKAHPILATTLVLGACLYVNSTSMAQTRFDEDASTNYPPTIPQQIRVRELPQIRVRELPQFWVRELTQWPFSGSTSADNSRRAELRKLNELKEKLCDSDGERRDVVIDEVKTVFGEYFEQDMKYRRAELDRLKQRADTTEAQLKKRQDARQRLIDLQLEAFKQEADGLGLFGSRSQLRQQIKSVRKLYPSQVRHPGFQQGQPQSGDRYGVTMGASAMMKPMGGNSIKAAGQQQIESARRKLASAANGDEQAKALETLKDALSKYFDQDMEARRTKVENVRAGLGKLQAQLEKRQSAKSDIIALQLKLIVNEADGLGFFSRSAQSPR